MRSRSVADRILVDPRAQRLPVEGAELFLVERFVSKADCARLIARIDARCEPSPLFAPDPGFRTSQTCFLDPSDPTVQGIEMRLARLTGIDPAHGEPVQGQRYGPSEQFKPHYDFFFTDQPYWPEQERRGGQRTWTAMAFLNEVEEGGETDFPTIGVRVAPRAGNLLAWNNLDAEVAPNMRLLHQGMPVIAGTKYVITKWYRERPWT